MGEEERGLESMNPTELLREQTRLLREISLMAAQTQTAQLRVREEMAKLTQQFEAAQQRAMPTNVMDVQMSLGSMVVFMIKWAIASIPAGLVLGVLAAVVMFLLSLVGLGIGSQLW